MSEPETLKAPSLWLPEPNVVLHQAIGKMGEEASELSKIAFRVLIQGIDECDPDSKVPNHTALWKEMADVEALIGTVKTKLREHDKPVDESPYNKRRLAKEWHKSQWLANVLQHIKSIVTKREPCPNCECGECDKLRWPNGSDAVKP